MAENCIIDNGYVFDCQGTGGVKNVWIGTYSSAIKWELDLNNKVTGVAAGSPVVYKFDQFEQVAGLTQTGVYGENRTKAIQTTLNIKLDHFDENLINEYRALTKAYVFAIVESNEGTFGIIGVETPGRATADTAGFGVAFTDMNGVDLTYTWNSTNGLYALDGSIIGTEIVVGVNS